MPQVLLLYQNLYDFELNYFNSSSAKQFALSKKKGDRDFEAKELVFPKQNISFSP